MNPESSLPNASTPNVPAAQPAAPAPVTATAPQTPAAAPAATTHPSAPKARKAGKKKVSFNAPTL